MSMIYSFVARVSDRVVLAEYAACAGNFKTLALECLQNLQRLEEKFTITVDAYTFNFVRTRDYVFLVVADESFGRQVPFAYLERVRGAFLEKFADKGRNAPAGGLERTFQPTLRAQLEYCMQHPEEINKMAAVQRKVDEVRGIMVANVESVLERGQRLDDLVDRSDSLRDQAAKFQKKGTQLRKNMWWRNFRMQIIVVVCVLLLVVVIFLLACFSGGKNCTKRADPTNPLVSPSPQPLASPIPGAPASTG